MKKTNENIFNYTLSIGFVFLIVVFLISLIGITKYSLSNENPVKEHVTSTKSLIDDINEVEKSVVKKEDESKTEEVKTEPGDFFITNFDDEIADLSYLNMIKQQKGLVTFVFNSSIGVYENIYYVSLSDKYSIDKKDIIIYHVDDLVKVGKVFDVQFIEDEGFYKYKVIDEVNHVDEIRKSNIFGLVLFKNGGKED